MRTLTALSRATLVAGLLLGAPGCIIEPFDICAEDPPDPRCRDASVQPDGGGDGGGGADAGPCGVCPGDTPLCRVSDGECVACLGDDDCGDTLICDTEAGACVACTSHAHCPASAPICGEDNTCRGCTGSSTSSECAERDPSARVCDAGICVECSAEEPSACGGNPCTTGNTCSSFGAGEQRACEPCDTDANCAPDHYCVPMRYQGADRPGGYCLKSTAGGCEQPFSIATMARTTLSGADGMTFCGINETLTTCEAVRALLDNEMCPFGTDEECPEGGICRTVGVLLHRCTYECSAASECLGPPTAGSTCGDGPLNTAPDYCGG